VGDGITICGTAGTGMNADAGIAAHGAATAAAAAAGIAAGGAAGAGCGVTAAAAAAARAAVAAGPGITVGLGMAWRCLSSASECAKKQMPRVQDAPLRHILVLNLKTAAAAAAVTQPRVSTWDS
jgi:hypothetical protein